MEISDKSSKNYWDDVWRGRRPAKYVGPFVEAHPLLKRYLPVERTFKFLEIGCVPGNWMVYFHKEYRYQVSGIDYSDAVSLVHETCELNQVPATICHGDVFYAQFPMLFDVIFSAGFVEHFEEWQRVLELHLQWLRPGGYVIISVPNVRGIHKLLMRAWSPADFAMQRLEIISRPEKLREFLSGSCKILYFGYWVTWRPFYELPRSLDFTSRAIRRILRMTGLQNLPNRHFSPSLWVIASKCQIKNSDSSDSLGKC